MHVPNSKMGTRLWNIYKSGIEIFTLTGAAFGFCCTYLDARQQNCPELDIFILSTLGCAVTGAVSFVISLFWPIILPLVLIGLAKGEQTGKLSFHIYHNF